jgi:hypothetical protein
MRYKECHKPLLRNLQGLILVRAAFEAGYFPHLLYNEGSIKCSLPHSITSQYENLCDADLHPAQSGYWVDLYPAVEKKI